MNSCFSLKEVFSAVESSETKSSISGDDRTVLHAKYPAKTAEKNTKINLKGHISIFRETPKQETLCVCLPVIKRREVESTFRFCTPFSFSMPLLYQMQGLLKSRCGWKEAPKSLRSQWQLHRSPTATCAHTIICWHIMTFVGAIFWW